jgi:hypothetical protein
MLIALRKNDLRILFPGVVSPATVAKPEAQAETHESVVPEGLASPRATMQTYLDAITEVKAGRRERHRFLLDCLRLADQLGPDPDAVSAPGGKTGWNRRNRRS